MKTGWTFGGAILLGLTMGFTEANGSLGDVLGPDPFQVSWIEGG